MSNRLKKGDSVPYAQIANDILRNPDLSLKAKGLYSYMYSMADGWNFTASSMSSQLKEGRKSILSILNELKDFGLIEYKKLYNGKGVYTIYSSINLTIKPESQNGTMSKIRQSVKTTPCQNDTVPKEDCIKNKDSIKNKDFNKNPIKGQDYKSSSKSKSKNKINKLNLNKEEYDYKTKLVNHSYVGFLRTLMVEGKLENVYIDDSRKIYSDSRSNKQIVGSTLTEIYKQLHEINEMMKNSDTKRLNESFSNLKDK